MASDDRDARASPIGALFDLGEFAPPVDDVSEAGPPPTRVLPRDLVDNDVITRATDTAILPAPSRRGRAVAMAIAVFGLGILVFAMSVVTAREDDPPVQITPTPDRSPTVVPRPTPTPRAVVTESEVESAPSAAAPPTARVAIPATARGPEIGDHLRALHLDEADVRATPATAILWDRQDHARTQEERAAAVLELRRALAKPDVYAAVLDEKLARVATRLRALDDHVPGERLRSLESRYFELRGQRDRAGLDVRASKIAALERDVMTEARR